MNFKTIIVFTILTILRNYLGIQCEELQLNGVQCKELQLDDSERIEEYYLSFNRESTDLFHKKCEELILYYIKLNSIQLIEELRETIKSLRSDYLRLLLLSSEWKTDGPRFDFYRQMHNIIEKNGFMDVENSYIDKIILKSDIEEDNDKHLKNCMICKRTFESIFKQPANLEEKFLEEIQRNIETPLMKKEQSNKHQIWTDLWNIINSKKKNESTPYNNCNSKDFGNIMPLMNEDDLKEYTGYRKEDSKKSLLFGIIQKSLKNIFDGMNYILNKLPFKELSFEEFSTLKTENTVNAEILLIFKSMLKDVTNITKCIHKIQILREMRKNAGKENDFQYSLEFQLDDDYKIFINNTIFKWSDMCPDCVKNDHKLNDFEVNELKKIAYNSKNQLIEFVKDREDEITEIKMKSSMYGYYLLDTSENIYNSFINGNDMTDKMLLLDMRLWLQIIRGYVKKLYYDGTNSLNMYGNSLSGYQKENVAQIIMPTENLSKFII